MQEKPNDISVQLFRKKCAKHGLRVTPQRIAIFEELSKAEDHPSSEDIYKRIRKKLPHVSFDTVYRTLLSFSKIGLINVVEGYGDRKRFDPNIHNHHHLRCIQCHAIIDFYNDSYDKIVVPKEIKQKFQVLNKKVILEGICKKCSNNI